VLLFHILCVTFSQLWGPVSFYSVTKSPSYSKWVIHVNNVCMISGTVELSDRQEICLNMVYPKGLRVTFSQSLIQDLSN
jgi:hypothetical protein